MPVTLYPPPPVRHPPTDVGNDVATLNVQRLEEAIAYLYVALKANRKKKVHAQRITETPHASPTE